MDVLSSIVQYILSPLIIVGILAKIVKWGWENYKKYHDERDKNKEANFLNFTKKVTPVVEKIPHIEKDVEEIKDQHQEISTHVKKIPVIQLGIVQLQGEHSILNERVSKLEKQKNDSTRD